MDPFRGSIHFKGAAAACCGPTAVAIITGTHFDKVWELFRMNKNANWKGGVRDSEIARVLNILGFAQHRVFQYGEYDLRTFVNYLADPSTPYLVYVPGHVVVVCEGHIYDQGGRRTIAQVPRPSTRVDKAFTLTEASAQKSALDSFMDSMQ